jgi:hypothetical protein
VSETREWGALEEAVIGMFRAIPNGVSVDSKTPSIKIFGESTKIGEASLVRFMEICDKDLIGDINQQPQSAKKPPSFWYLLNMGAFSGVKYDVAMTKVTLQACGCVSWSLSLYSHASSSCCRFLSVVSLFETDY